jgi:ribose transport system permease protein
MTMTEADLPMPVAVQSPTTEGRLQTALARRLVGQTPALQVAAFVVLFAATAMTIDGFLTRPSIYSALVLAAFLGIAALGQTLVILIGGIDLSVPALISAANLVAPMLSAKGWGFGLVIAFVVGAGALVGALNGYLIRRLGVSALIVTLATGGIVTGFALALTKNGFAQGNVPAWLSSFSSPVGHTFGVAIPPVVVLWAVVAIVMGIVLHRSVTGRHLYATGANQRAAELAGVRTIRVWVGSFALSGAAAATVGLLLTGFVGSATVGIGDPYLFTSLAAVLVGGTSLVGARGDYWRTVLGALILTLITTMLVGHGAGVDTQEIIFGVLILVFVGLYGRDRRVRDRV